MRQAALLLAGVLVLVPLVLLQLALAPLLRCWLLRQAALLLRLQPWHRSWMRRADLLPPDALLLAGSPAGSLAGSPAEPHAARLTARARSAFRIAREGSAAEYFVTARE